MKSKTSLFKKGIIISDLKRYWWISAIFSLGLLISIPLAHYMQKFSLEERHQEINLIKQSIQRELSFRSGVSVLFPFVVPILIAVLTYRYIQKGRSASLYHSLPLTRTALYLNSFVSSLLLYIVPLLINVVVMLLLNCFSFLSDFYTVPLIFGWLGYSLLFGIMFMSMTIFVGMFTGSSIAQIAFVYILNFLPAFLYEVIRANLSELLYGFSTYSDTNFYHWLPMVRLYNNYEGFTPGIIAGYIVLTVLLAAAGLVAFKVRRPETAGDIITFKPIKPVFIIGVTVCSTLVGGAYFSMIGRSNLPSIIFGYFAGSLLGYIIVQMVTNKTFKVLKTYKGYLAYALVMVILLLGIKFDVLGYVNKVPSSDQISEVYMGSNIYWWNDKDNLNSKFASVYEDITVYTDKTDIRNITNLHKIILENRSRNNNYYDYIAYKLKNGRKIIRYYGIDTNLYASALGPIYESKEYKDSRYPILHQEPENLKFIQIHDFSNNKPPVVISDKAKLQSFINAIRKDVNSFTYDEIVSGDADNHQIEVTDIKDRIVNYALNSKYKNTLDWINSLN
ncbi:MAG TPA: DUF6449 domain-containing protein [Ruminiclostridium sp.]|nr:DUF6449 domain-containing protein [Ruminiclostridium sp.]